MVRRFLERWRGLETVAISLMLLPGAGCALVPATLREGAARGPVDPAHVYASYQFDTGPGVLSFGVQLLWIPTCVIWERVPACGRARDERLRDDLPIGVACGGHSTSTSCPESSPMPHATISPTCAWARVSHRPGS